MAEEPNAASADLLPDVTVTIEPEKPDNVVIDPAVKDLADQYKAMEDKAKENEAARDAANARAEQASRDAEAARREAQQAREQATTSNLDTITTALSAAQGALDAAKKDWLVARESGNPEAEVDAADRMNQARIDMRTYDEAKTNLEARKTQRQPDPQSPPDPVEAYVARRSAPTAKWLREHRDYILDPDKNNELTAAHYSALAKRLAPDTPAYFEHVEKTLGLKTEVTEGDSVQRPGAAKEAAKEAKKSSARAVAPVNGSAGSGGAVSKNTVTLTAGEARAAVDGTHVWNYDDQSGQKKYKKGEPIGVEEFARRKQKMQESGQYDRTFETQ